MSNKTSTNGFFSLQNFNAPKIVRQRPDANSIAHFRRIWHEWRPGKASFYDFYISVCWIIITYKSIKMASKSSPETLLHQFGDSNSLSGENMKKEFLHEAASDAFLNRLYVEKRMARNVRRGVTGQKTINLKMRNRLAKWLLQINNQTFNFSSKTFINALQILDEYLENTDQHFSQLQLIGCACLYLSSKINENTIIAGQCYVECSGSIFTKQQLMKKEQLIFQSLGLNVNFESPLRIINKMGQLAEVNAQKLQKATDFVTWTFFNEKYQGFCQYDIALAIIMVTLQSADLTEQSVLAKLTQGIQA